MRKEALVRVFMVLAALMMALPLQAQELEEGAWTGFMVSPGRQPFAVGYTVATEGDSLRIAMNVKDWQTGLFPFHDVHLKNDLLSFWWTPSFRVDCLLQRGEKRIFLGACRDEGGNLGPMLMAPPGVAAEPSDLDLDVAFSLWRAEQKRAEMRRYEGPLGTKVDIGGYGLNMLATGEGDVTVVLEAGLADDLRTWDDIQYEVERFARVVSYDRAGIGHSDASPAPRTPQQVAEELHTLLQTAGIKPPYVLVGHALGGFFVRTFAARYPDEVAGLVLVDAYHEAQGRRWRALDPASWDSSMARQKALYAQARASLQAEFALYETIMETGQLPGVGPLPDVPTVVLTALRPVDAPQWVGETPEGQEVWRSLHDAWVRQGHDGTHLITKTSGSYIQLEEPDLVVKAIRQVVEAVSALSTSAQ